MAREPKKKKQAEDQAQDQSGTQENAGGQEPPKRQPDDAIAAVAEDFDSFSEADEGGLALVDELGIEDLQEVIFGGRGRLFSAAGRETPIAELTAEAVVLHPPQRPLDDILSIEEITNLADEQGIMLNELGEQRRIAGAKFRGSAIYTLSEIKPGTLKHYAGWFDVEGKSHKFFVQGEPLTVDMLFRIRNRTHDGEISIFPEISSE